MKRQGLRNDDVNKLVREFQSSRDEGKGPDEAWANAKRLTQDISPEVLDSWRPEVQRLAESGTVSAPLVATDLVTRANQVEAENITLKKKLADFGAKAEATEKEIHKQYEDEINRLRADVEKLKKENESLVMGDPTPTTKKHK
jgi:hypothetical protein